VSGLSNGKSSSLKGPLKTFLANANQYITAIKKYPTTMTQVQLNDFGSCTYYLPCSSVTNVVGNKNMMEVPINQTTEIQPKISDIQPKWNLDRLNDFLAYVSLISIGIA
jgi:hypothetical protein